MRHQKRLGGLSLAVLSSAFLSSCVNDIKVSGSNIKETAEPATLELQFYNSDSAQWEALTAASHNEYRYMDCLNGAEYNFRLLNHGPGKLVSSETPTVTKTTALTSPTLITGVTTSYSITTPPQFPVEPGDFSEFTVTLSASTGPFGPSYCFLSAKNAPLYDVFTYDQFTLALKTNDPANPNFEASLLFLGGS